jgi:hypothetical protein
MLMVMLMADAMLGARTYGGVHRQLRRLERRKVEMSSGREGCESISCGLETRRQMRGRNRELKTQARAAAAAAPAETTHAERMILQLPDVAR